MIYSKQDVQINIFYPLIWFHTHCRKKKVRVTSVTNSRQFVNKKKMTFTAKENISKSQYEMSFGWIICIFYKHIAKMSVLVINTIWFANSLNYCCHSDQWWSKFLDLGSSKGFQLMFQSYIHYNENLNDF